MKTRVEVSSNVERSARVLQVEGMFDIPPSKRSQLAWDVNLPIEEKSWNVGLIVGPSGCGKSSVARQLWPGPISAVYSWDSSKSLLDSFPRSLGIKDLVTILNSVGFSSPPSWVRPFSVLSNGEQFRVTMARALAESQSVQNVAGGIPQIVVMDEFTSVVDRTVAQIGSHAMSKTVRARNQQFVAVTCHEDVEEWLQPDWVFRPATCDFRWRELRRRPSIELEIRRIHHSNWKYFHHHHYLDRNLHHASTCFGAFWKGRLVAFDSWLPFVGRLNGTAKGRRGHRSVCLPDYQGVGIGNSLIDTIASMWAGLGYRVFDGTAHPALISSRIKAGKWKMTRAPSFTPTDHGRLQHLSASRASSRLTASFEWSGHKMDRESALRLLNTWHTVEK